MLYTAMVVPITPQKMTLVVFLSIFLSVNFFEKYKSLLFLFFVLKLPSLKIFLICSYSL